jgi:hypothetical protein
LVGSDDARRRLVLFEDPQCPYCRQVEEASGDLLRREVAAGAVAVEYRMRCFLGPESVRADNALGLAAEAGRFDQLRRELFASQPPEHSGGFTVEDLLGLGRRVGLDDPDYVTGVRRGGTRPGWSRSTGDSRSRIRAAHPRPSSTVSRSTPPCCTTARHWEPAARLTALVTVERPSAQQRKRGRRRAAAGTTSSVLSRTGTPPPEPG